MARLWKSTQMFRELGYQQEKDNSIIIFYKHDGDADDVCIGFDLDEKTVSKYRNGFAEAITLDEYKCIEQKIKELHWLDYRPSFPKKTISYIRVDIEKDNKCIVLFIMDFFGVTDTFVHCYEWSDVDALRVPIQNKYDLNNSEFSALIDLIKNHWDEATDKKPYTIHIDFERLKELVK